MNKNIIINIRNLNKKFVRTCALDDVSLAVYQNEILAIVGDNGAGKSTLIKILAGVEKPDHGTIEIGEQFYPYLTPVEAIKHGIITVYQDLALIDSMDIIANIFLGNELTGRFGILNKKQMMQETVALLEKLKINIPNLQALAGELSGGQRQVLAIARAIRLGGKILILDEPTAALGIRETRKLLILIKELKVQGYTTIIILHNLHQVFELSDRLCVLRQGKIVAIQDTQNSHPNKVVRLITGISEKDYAEYEV